MAVSLGDPGGVGAEIVCKALSIKELRESARWILVGVGSAVGWAPGGKFPVEVVPATRLFEVGVRGGAGAVTLVDCADSLARASGSLGVGVGNAWPAVSNAAAGEASFRFVERAIELAKMDTSSPWHADAVVTAPISKEAWSLAGHGEYPGHTELFARAFGVERFAMMFHAPPAGARHDTQHGTPDAHRLTPGLNVILTTVHRPLREVPTLLTMKRVLDAIELGSAATVRLGVPAPRVGVCGLNPHAGEHGLLGHEDGAIIAPAVAAARAKGIDAIGPLPADTIFQGALAFPGQRPAKFDLVVAMYHDQGLIPLKTIAWDRAVNMTVGLPIVRTSPDHGTAFDIAGKGTADAGSMRAAMELAVKMASEHTRPRRARRASGGF